MKLLRTVLVLLICLIGMTSMTSDNLSEWVSLFDGKTLNGWKAAEHPGTFTVADGAIVVYGDRAHLFYEGAVNNHDFKNFELKLKVMTFPGANSGIFIHTVYQQEGWPSKGYEVQVNNTQSDWRRTASIYAVQDVKEVYMKDNEWFDMHITVQGKRITVKLNDNVVNDFTEGENGRLTGGTVALQGHDPGSKVMYKDIMIKILPD
ncbi:MAG: DUF1080 domain-containing protein [Cyclobacteriaceae bacterium]|nr:DUF1080 domain-containing protein [Cyclobacteriaceae bacterium]